MNLAIESKVGRKRVKIDKTAKLIDLKDMIEKEIFIPKNQQKLLNGFPPLELIDDEKTLEALGVRSGDKIMVQEAIGTSSSGSNDSVPQDKMVCKRPLFVTSHNDQGTVVRRIVDANNACLFNCIGYNFEGKTRSKSPELRQLIISILKSDVLTYSEAFLGKENHDYCKWIENKDAWGGAIELSIFAEYYMTEIAVFDIQTTKMYLYGEGCNFKQRCYLIYDGLHYDPLALAKSENSGESEDITLFETTDKFVEKQGQALCDKMHQQNLFTDTSKFMLRCLVCGKGLSGENEAMEHCKLTKHTNFAEYNK
eukprot:TRINITY_DN6979_c0_g1_i1.p1 TRINITY_DN6979_c0_g1~~TRINITY_DN6979_c0_g1_i1.p1  ORF type:complete len:310 (-),score=94.64 TRINITY_DN6979_c0_g1_i1:69-998(-)